MERRDLFGRTEAELRASIAGQERVYAIAASYGGTEGAALNLARKKANLEVDRRQLSIMLGESADDAPRLSEQARSKLYREILSLGRYSAHGALRS